MIKLTKGPTPKVLIDNASKWTNEYLTTLNAGQKPSDIVAHRYNHPDIKNALEKETHGKCAYCESKIKHVEYGDIEHILPKNEDARPDLYVEWTNLTLACEVCNRGNKKTYYSKELPLINPYIDNPDDYFIFVGTIISAKSNNDRAYVTESRLDLNRIDLVERRTERLQSVNKMLYSWSHASNPEIKDTLANELRKECTSDKEYSAFVKHFLIIKGFPLQE